MSYENKIDFTERLQTLKQEITALYLGCKTDNSFNSVLQIRFNSDSVYQYSDVPADVFDSLLRSVSKGLYFNSYIKDVYDFQLVDD